MAADPRLFEMLAQALSQPSKSYRAAQAGLSIPEGAVSGYESGLKTGNDITALKNAPAMAALSAQEAKLKPYEIYSKIAEQSGTDVANSIFQKQGIPVPDMPSNTGGQSLDAMLKQFDVNPMSFPPKIRGMLATARNQGVSNDIKQQIADALSARVGVMQKGQELSAQKAASQYGGGAAAQPSIKESFNRVAQIQRTRGLLDQIRAQGGQANPQQRAELAMSTARTINPSGVLTNEAMDMMLPQSAVGKYGSAMQYLQNAPYDTEFAGFANRFSDLMDREEKINKNIIQGGSQYATPFERFGAKIPTSQGNPNIQTDVAGQGTGDPEADAAIAKINSAPISDGEKQSRISAVKARVSR